MDDLRSSQSNIMSTNMEYFEVDYRKLSCPPESQDDPRYKEIGNQCFYYETTSFSQAKAQENCKDKFRKIGAGGKLFEPKTLAKNKAVAEAGQPTLGNTWVHIGVDNIGNNETFKYSSGEHLISILNPPWYSASYPRGTGSNCVRVYFNINHSNFAKWVDEGCEHSRPSICEATLHLPLADLPALVDIKVIVYYWSLVQYLLYMTFIHDLISRMKWTI